MKKTLLFFTLLTFSLLNAQNVTIPDANFKAYLLNNSSINTNGDDEIQVSEAENTTEIECHYRNISDLTGIEAFVNLTTLNCNSNSLNFLDISQNTSLIELNCHSNQLSSLDISQNTILIELHCGYNSLNTLDISQNTSLEILYCSSNLLNTLDVTQNINLFVLVCDHNQLSVLDVTQNPSLINLYCDYNQLINLDVSQQHSSLTGLIISNNPNLEYINLKNGNNTYLTTIHDILGSDFTNLPNLQNVCVDALNTDLTDFITAETGHTVNYSTDCSALSVSSNEAQSLQFSVYPTPSKGLLNISSRTGVKNVAIYNKLGQLVLEATNTQQVTIANLAKGLYFVKVTDENGDFGVRKIIKE